MVSPQRHRDSPPSPAGPIGRPTRALRMIESQKSKNQSHPCRANSALTCLAPARYPGSEPVARGGRAAPRAGMAGLRRDVRSRARSARPTRGHRARPATALRPFPGRLNHFTLDRSPRLIVPLDRRNPAAAFDLTPNKNSPVEKRRSPHDRTPQKNCAEPRHGRITRFGKERWKCLSSSLTEKTSLR